MNCYGVNVRMPSTFQENRTKVSSDWSMDPDFENQTKPKSLIQLYKTSANSMEQSPSREAKKFLISQEISIILWNPEFHYHIHKGLFPPPPMIQINPVNSRPYNSSRSILILYFHLHLGFPHGILASGFRTKTMQASVLSPVYVQHVSPIFFFLIWPPE